MKCSECDEEMELTYVSFNLELEQEYGNPVEIETWFCSQCLQYHEEEIIHYSKNSFKKVME